jgi:hypothetical protein
LKLFRFRVHVELMFSLPEIDKMAKHRWGFKGLFGIDGCVSDICAVWAEAKITNSPIHMVYRGKHSPSDIKSQDARHVMKGSEQAIELGILIGGMRVAQPGNGSDRVMKIDQQR